MQFGHAGTVNFAAPTPPSPVPRLLPIRPPQFVNRAGQLEALDVELSRWEHGDRDLCLLTVSGDGGIGKSALLHEWGHRRQEHFPGGTLYVDLVGWRRAGGGVDLGTIAAGFARELGADPAAIGASPAERTAAYRSATAGRRLLLVIDHAEQAAEVRALLPRHGMVLVTSRRPLRQLRMDGARPLPLDPLDAAAGRALIRSWLDESEVGDAALTELVRLCEGRPVRLRAVGEQLLDETGASVHRVVAELATARSQHRPAAEAAWEAVYRALPGSRRQLLARLCGLPGTTFPGELALALGVADAPAGLAALRAAGLVQQTAPGHYAVPGEVAEHADRLVAEVPAADREAALRAAVGFAVAACERVDRAVLGERLRLAGRGATAAPAAPAVLPALDSPAAALDWLERELGTVLALLDAARAHGWHEAVWRGCQALWAFFHSRKPYTDWIASHLAGIEAAGWDERPDAELRMRNQLARAYLELGDHAAADAALEPAVALLPVVAQPQLRGVIHETRALVARDTGRFTEAVEQFTAARAANAGDDRGVALQGYQLADTLRRFGRPAEALAELDAAAALVPGAEHAALHARIGLVRGLALRDLGHQTASCAVLEEAATLAERLGLWSKAEAALAALVAQAEGRDRATAARLAERLAAVRRRTGAPREP
ncbi:hypothetical protein RM844_05160 [Streptomyces sp. DSM 44915]|uniref:Tetratricopeptide repeat protein n=1 Tax=Streptomyces chisholmiae TaxID=3075540 RepID=A0ABU2JL14_9ACTN|nr:hypothetical protein [Streptomyces sp. DSM 44915]MDT0265677.1 hypothetical protein [Streptomyces sp. DSM 44915]